MSRLRSWLRNHNVSLALFVLGVALAGGVLTFAKPLATSEATRASVRASSAVSAGSVGRASALLEVLRRSATGHDALPPQLQSALSRLGVEVDITGARRALVTPQGNAVYLVPSNSGVCLIDSNNSESGCFSTEAVRDGRATQSDDCSPSLPDANTIEIAGVLPDGAADPTIIRADGTRQALKVDGNAYLAQFGSYAPLPTRIEWTSLGHAVTASAPVPSDVVSEDCVTPAEVKALEASGKVPRALGHPPAQPTVSTVYAKG